MMHHVVEEAASLLGGLLAIRRACEPNKGPGVGNRLQQGSTLHDQSSPTSSTSSTSSNNQTIKQSNKHDQLSSTPSSSGSLTRHLRIQCLSHLTRTSLCPVVWMDCGELHIMWRVVEVELVPHCTQALYHLQRHRPGNMMSAPALYSP
jgi:hypothetical protein